MIGYLNGKIKFIFDNEIILDVTGVGYRIITDTANLAIDEVAEFFIHTSVKDDAINLYGFKNRESFDMFKFLLTVSGVGEKSAMTILKKISPQDLMTTIINQDLQTLTKLPGIGKKTAERILFELKGKFKDLPLPNITDSATMKDATDALEALGYSVTEIAEVLSRAPKNLTTEKLITFALKELYK